MNELERIVRAAEAARDAGEGFLLATVVRVEGSSYRRPGARMLVAGGRWVAGCVSGGCLEGDVLLRGEHRTRAGAPALVTYDSTADDEVRWGLGLGCNGVVEVLIERVAAGADHDALAFARRCFEARVAGVLVTVFRSDDAAVPVGARLALGPPSPIAVPVPEGAIREALRAEAARPCGGARVVEVGGVRALVEAVTPSRRMFVIGRGHDVAPLVSIARAAGFDVTVATTRRASRPRFEGADEVTVDGPAALRRLFDAAYEAYVVVMSHEVDRDREALSAALASRARYVGVLGPAARTRRLLAALAAAGDGHDEASLARLHAPVGLDLGAETPEEIALAVVAEAQAASRGASAGRLRARDARALHARVACAVLAAGASRRLGRAKQLVPFRGATVLRHVTGQCLRAEVGPVAVVLGANARAVAPTLDGLDVTTLHNAAWEEGVASSIREAVAWAERAGASALLLALGDQALVPWAHLARLEAAWRAGAPAVASHFGEALGAPAVFDRSRWDALAALRGDQGAARLLRGDASVVAIACPEGACDVDTEADVAALAGAAEAPALHR